MNKAIKLFSVTCAAALLLPGLSVADLPNGFNLQAHRGGRDARPENTLASFAYAMAVGVTTLEMEKRVMLQSFDWRTLKIMKEIAPSIPTVALTAEQETWDTMEFEEGRYRWADRVQVSPWMAGLDIKDFNGDYVKAAHSMEYRFMDEKTTERTRSSALMRRIRLIKPQYQPFVNA